MSDREILHQAAMALGTALSDRQIEALARYAELLRGRGIDAGVVAAGDRDRLLTRHVLDSLRAVAGVHEEDRTAYDLGSGAGFPGVPIAVARPDLEMRLVDSRRRRVAWLELAIAELSLKNVQVVHSRIEQLQDPADCCFARALATPRRCWDLAEPLLRPGGKLIYFAGRKEALGVLSNAGARVEILPPVLESAGPLAIITRK